MRIIKYIILTWTLLLTNEGFSQNAIEIEKAYGQIYGIYVSERESKPTYINSKTLELNQDGTFIKVERWINLEFKLPQETVKTVKGKFVEIDEGIAIFPGETGIQTISYSSPSNVSDVNYKGSRKTAATSSDTTKLRVIKSDCASLLRLYTKPNSYYLCSDKSNHVYMKFLDTEVGNDFTSHTDEIRSTHYLNKFLNNYERQYRTKLNYTDSLLIECQIDSLKNDCEKFKDYIKKSIQENI